MSSGSLILILDPLYLPKTLALSGEYPNKLSQRMCVIERRNHRVDYLRSTAILLLERKVDRAKSPRVEPRRGLWHPESLDDRYLQGLGECDLHRGVG